MSNSVAFAVVGLGAMGSAVACQLARRGVEVVGLDSHAPPHALGSSGGETRITRQAVGEGEAYVPFILHSHRIWRELEAETGEDLFTRCGALVIGPGDGVSSHHGIADFTGRSIEAARRFGIEHEVLDGTEVSRRVPMFLGLTGDEKAYYEPGGGYLRPEACIRAHLAVAAAAGADIRFGNTVRAVERDGDAVLIETDQGSLRARQVIMAAGAWNAPLLGPPFDRHLTVSRQLLHWFELDDASAYDADSPAYIWMHGGADREYFYGFPPLPGDLRLKAAQEQYETTCTAETLDRVIDPAFAKRLYDNHLAGRLAGVTSRVAASAACLYTVTPDRGFVIDRHPTNDRVLAISACSGHGFKHSAGIGVAVAELLAEGRSRLDLTPFSLGRLTGAGS